MVDINTSNSYTLTDWSKLVSASLNQHYLETAKQHQTQLTKPSGALGQLENIAITLSGMQARSQPNINNIQISVFTADHGIACSGVSAFPQAVTTEMLRNFASGGAAISVLAKHLEAKLEVINLGTINDPGEIPGVIDLRIAPSTADFSKTNAMSESELRVAMDVGKLAVDRAIGNDCELFIGGEMGIGNTSSATAIACVLLDKTANELAGPGTGLDANGLKHKIHILEQALSLHSDLDKTQPLEVLRRLGGFEIAALVASYLNCAKRGLTVLVDGFISSSAALVATQLCENASDWFLYAHESAEPGHQAILDALNARPLLSLGMRLGEGSGAATAVPLIRLACELHNKMATFSEAAVSEKPN